MPKFLNNIDLNSNQLLNPVIHVSSQATTTNGPNGDATGTEGQIFYNSHSNGKALYFRDDSGWRPIGDISGVTAGAGLSGGGTGGTVSLAIDISEFSDVTPANGDKLLTLDSDGSTEQLTTVAALATLFAGTGLTASSSVIGVDASQTQITAVGTLGTGAISSGFGNIDIGSSDLTATGTVSLGATSFNDNNITNVGDINADSISVDAAGTGLNIDFSGANTAKSFITIGDNLAEALVIQEGTNDYLDICTTDGSETIHLGHGVSGTAITIGHSTSEVTIGDNLTVTGNLTVSGTTTTVDSTTVAVADSMLKLAKDQANTDDAVDFGFYGQFGVSGTHKYAGLFRDLSVSGDPFTFFTDLQAEPGTTVNTSGTGYALANIKAAGGNFTSISLPDDAIETSVIADGALPSGVTVSNDNWSGTDLSVPNGGTGASTFTDGGILLGNGTGAIQAMAVLADGEMIVGDGTTDPVAESGATLRTSIGVGTGDSPQFTGVELGHASDTTIARSAAGKATIEGNLIGVVETFNLDNSDSHVAANNGGSDSTVFTITHGLGDSRFYKVEVLLDSGNYDTVYTDVTRPSDTTIVITFASNVANGAYRAMVTRMA
tara:strand:+ start:522 stop:2336 length:1815 start_codon:yes stop_codon:yes gene_type:complete